MYSASLFGLLAFGVQCVPFRVFSCLFLSFPAFSCLFGLLAFMCTVHVFSPTFCGLSRRRLRGSELVCAWVRRMVRSPLPCGVPRGLERPLFRWRWRRVASLLAVGWCSVLASPFLAVRHWNSDSPALRSKKKCLRHYIASTKCLFDKWRTMKWCTITWVTSLKTHLICLHSIKNTSNISAQH